MHFVPFPRWRIPLVKLLAQALLVLAACGPALAVSWQIDREGSIFAVITHRAGFARALAHNHLVYPADYEVTLAGDPPEFASPAFELRLRARDLAVDDPEAQARWFPRIKDAGILDEPFPRVSEENRSEIRSAMLGEEQLDAETYPEIEASLSALEPIASSEGRFTHRAALKLRLHGRSVTREIPVRIESKGETLRVEGVGTLRFTEFGIEPYSAFFGAVKNQDVFHLFVDITARTFD